MPKPSGGLNQLVAQALMVPLAEPVYLIRETTGDLAQLRLACYPEIEQRPIWRPRSLECGLERPVGL